MENFFEELINSITIQNILSKPTVDSNFKFDKLGWYFFVSPISGVLIIKTIKEPDSIADNPGLIRFLKLKVLIVIGCDSQYDFTTMYGFAYDNLHMLNELQKRTISVLGKKKIHITTPGLYKLQLVDYVIDQYPYYVFNGIDAIVFKTHVNRLDSTLRDVDDYLNNPFHHFMYDLEGFVISKEYVDESIIKSLKIGKIYECKIDYISRNSIINKQLAIRQIYLPIKIDPI